MHGISGNMDGVYRAFWDQIEVIDRVERSVKERDLAGPNLGAEIAEGAEANWYLVQTFPGEDLRAMRWLARRRFGVFRPMAPKTGGGGEPIFAGWLFVYAWDIEKMRARIRATPGVMDILHDPVSLKPVPIDDWFVQKLRTESWKIQPVRQRVAIPANPQAPAKPRRPDKRERKMLDSLKKVMKQKGITYSEAGWELINGLEPRLRIAVLECTVSQRSVSSSIAGG